MKAVMAKCGFRCDLCPAYEPNRGQMAGLEEISQGWFKYFGFQIPPDEIRCVGCLNEGQHADKDCPVRPCAIQRKIDNCGLCKDFGCDRLKSRMNFIEVYIKNPSTVPERDYHLYVEPYLSRSRLDVIRKNAGDGPDQTF